MLHRVGVFVQGSNARRGLSIERRIVDQLSYGSLSRIDFGGDQVEVVGGCLDAFESPLAGVQELICLLEQIRDLTGIHSWDLRPPLVSYSTTVTASPTPG